MNLSTQRSFRLPRLWSNEALRTIAPIFQGEVINVSGWNDSDKEGGRYRDYFSHATAYYLSNHSGRRGLSEDEDLTDFSLDLTLPLPAELQLRFDVVYSHTTLEHIFDVQMAFANLCRMSRDTVIVIVPFAQEVHFTPSYGDYWRFAPMSVRALFAKNEFDVVFESASPHKNAGIYLLTVGSREPERWQGKFPPWSAVEVLGTWIGASWWRRLLRRVDPRGSAVR